MFSSTVRLAVLQDVEGWLALAKEVEDLFGPMSDVPEFREALAAAIEGGHAFTALRPSEKCLNSVTGGIVVSQEMNSIEWFVVSGAARGLGIGRQLLTAALAHLDSAKSVSVQTFAPSCSEGLAARQLYMKFGFEDREPMGPNPAGVQTVLMVKQPHPKVG